MGSRGFENVLESELPPHLQGRKALGGQQVITRRHCPLVVTLTAKLKSLSLGDAPSAWGMRTPLPDSGSYHCLTCPGSPRALLAAKVYASKLPLVVSVCTCLYICAQMFVCCDHDCRLDGR